jgi:membrane carboxypeptidase/penicillin-binding protein
MLIRLVEGYGIDKSWRPLDEISPQLIRTAMAGEDTRFCRHRGFDWGAVATAHAARRQVLDRCSRKAKVVLAQYQTSQSVNEGKLMFITM